MTCAIQERMLIHHALQPVLLNTNAAGMITKKHNVKNEIRKDWIPFLTLKRTPAETTETGGCAVKSYR